MFSQSVTMTTLSRPSCSLMVPEMSIIRVSAFESPFDNSQLTVILNRGLSISKKMDDKLHELEKVLLIRLRECRMRLNELRLNQSEEPQINNKNSFRYFYCGKPYFKDSQNKPAPGNVDTLFMQHHQMYDFTTISLAPGWTVKDKSDFISVILKISQDIKIRELNLKISNIKCQGKISKTNDDVIDKDIEVIRKEIEAVSKKKLKDIALPIDKEYDWENIAYMLNLRHSAQEYSSLWKLFLHPSINKNKWSKNEHLKLNKIAKENNFQDWNKIASQLNTGRTGYQCFVYYCTNVNSDYSGRKWTKEEEEYLSRSIEFYREGEYIPWGKVAASLENRTKISIYNKYRLLSVKRKGRFLAEEDAVILTFAEKFGPNFKKMKKHFPGRSITQLRVRYEILKKRSVSAVWTVEEDRKLVELMANQEEGTNWSDFSKHFPGKDRTHLRSRYNILAKWIKQYPNIDISFAPRRAARRLMHGKVTNNLHKAVTKLTTKIDSQASQPKPHGITMNSSEQEIDNAIISQLALEAAKDRSKQFVNPEENAEKNKTSSGSINIRNLQLILILLRSKLDENLFKASSDCTKYQGVDDPRNAFSLVQIKSYSRKKKEESITDFPNIYGHKQLSTPSYVLPPHFATINALWKLVACIDDKDNLKSCKNIVLSKKNPILKQQMLVLMERFNLLFVWPLLLSNCHPPRSRIISTAAATSAPSTSAAMEKK